MPMITLSLAIEFSGVDAGFGDEVVLGYEVETPTKVGRVETEVEIKAAGAGITMAGSAITAIEKLRIAPRPFDAIIATDPEAGVPMKAMEMEPLARAALVKVEEAVKAAVTESVL